MSRMQSRISGVLLGGMLVSLLACSEANRNTAPVELVATAKLQNTDINLQTPPDPLTVAEIDVQAITKASSSTVPNDPRFLDVHITAYRVSYIRTDGGKTVPAPFTVSSDQLITADAQPAKLNIFIAYQPGALNNAPFAALLAQNGGVDPETGRRSILLDVKVEIFGQTLSGQNVYTTARFPIEVFNGA